MRITILTSVIGLLVYSAAGTIGFCAVIASGTANVTAPAEGATISGQVALISTASQAVTKTGTTTNTVEVHSFQHTDTGKAQMCVILGHTWGPNETGSWENIDDMSVVWNTASDPNGTHSGGCWSDWVHDVAQPGCLDFSSWTNLATDKNCFTIQN